MSFFHSLIISCLSFFLAVSLESHHEIFHAENKYAARITAKPKLAMNEVAARINKFNFNFNDVVAKKGENVIFSPFSIYTALAMVGVGAETNTKKEIANALHSREGDFLPLLQMLAPLYKELSKNEGSTLDIANKAWVGNNTDIIKTYQVNLMKYFDVEMGREDFLNDPESARKDINDWVEEKTEHNIKELFSPGSIDKMTQLVLANAIYFKGEWQNKFDIDDTFEDKFYVNSDEKVSVNFMFKHDKFSTAFDKEHKIQLLELPYAGGKFSMIFAIPFAKQDMNGVIESFEDLSKVEADIEDKTAVLQKWIQLLPDARKVVSEMDIMVPKFEIKLGLDLLDNLQKLGINDVFIPGAADLSGIKEGKDLYISSAVHKAFIKVDEEGTTAAAATGLVANTYSFGPPEEVFLNHPFLFYIIHRDSKALIFSGKIENPVKLA